ncbi:hypothetical protein BSKO_09960 [Bryopsis sp. KO-2023]|nr:hypothetical protein BSKO_09960 [Bryopsis sp. KO-2023]
MLSKHVRVPMGTPLPSMGKGVRVGLGARLPARQPKLISQRRGIFQRGSRIQSSIDPLPGIDLQKDVLECPTLVEHLSPRPSPFVPHKNFGGGFVDDDDRVSLVSMQFASSESTGAGCQGIRYSHKDAGGDEFEECLVLPPWAVRAGARETIYHNPERVTAAIVTCGGLCPGLNDVVLGLVHKLEHYGVPKGQILGIRYGFRGFYDREHKPIVLTSKKVDGIQLQGGTILGTSRGGANMKEIVKKIDMWGVNMLFVVGGNGGNAGANAIHEYCKTHDVHCSVVGVPKSIDNDILLIDRCFGFETAVEEAQRALLAAKIEASSAHQGIGLVKLMGRQSGFIAMQAALASGVVDACLIPEVPFEVHGPYGLFAYLRSILRTKGHAVVCVAEGAGQSLLHASNSNGGERDASGNPILQDIGKYLRSEMKKNFSEADIKYIDPTYMIRAIPASSTDRIYCKILAHNAVHAAFAGYTGITVGLVNTHYVYLPIPVIIMSPRNVDPKGKMWNRLRASIGQPTFLSPDGAELSFDETAMEPMGQFGEGGATKIILP